MAQVRQLRLVVTATDYDEALAFSATLWVWPKRERTKPTAAG